MCLDELEFARTSKTNAYRAGAAGQIVAAAIEVIAESGAQASFKVIAERAALSSTGLISYHFANRQELIDEVGRQILEAFSAFVLDRTDGIEEPAEILQEFVAANIAFLQTHRAHGAALVGIQQDTAALARSDQAQLADVLRRGQERAYCGRSTRS
jgi:AcrR family transcriptional regulator